MKKDFAVIFDLDGTLLNTDLLIRKSFEHVFHHYKPDYQMSDQEHLSFLGPALKDTFSRYFPDEMIEELIDYYRAYNHAHHQDYVTIYPRVEETLKTLSKQGYPLAVVTTKYRQAALIGLDLFEITPYFDMILGMDDVEHVKPNPEGILKVMNTFHCLNGLYIGDNVTDIQAGKNAGIYTAGVKWTPKGYQDMQALAPDLLIDDMSEIITFVERKMNG